jgi:hydrogenase maturation factor
VSGRCDGPVCLTCADQADLATVRRVDGDVAVVHPVGAPQGRTVDVSLVLPVVPGDEVLVHAGVAIARITPDTAAPVPAAHEVPS